MLIDPNAAACSRCGQPVPPAEAGDLCRRCRTATAAISEPGWGATQAGPVLDTLAASVGYVPRILLPDTGAGATEPPLVNPASPEMPGPADRMARVQLLGEIARGGMGVVLKGRDPDLGRDLAVKVLLDSHRENPDLVRRFVEEAQIGGQLQHPGVVPVYELGTFSDRRPYFTMKLVKGQTLAELLGDRTAPADDLPRFLAIFEQACQTMAYAHARDVIHRDLKPSNVMVGSFGEVQVMDWGLAKVLSRGGVVDDASAGKDQVNATVIATARLGSDSELSQAGSVLGTPAYMAPEQARGEIDQVDERADVFALGSILCEILTGRPAFAGRSAGEIQRKAALGDLADALAALEASGADGELIALARDCVAREAVDRPRHAGVVAERIIAYRNDVQERLRAAEIAQATERARAEESQRTAEVAKAKALAERRAHRLTGALAASVLGLVVSLGGGYAYFQRQSEERRSRVDLALREAEVLRSAALQASNDPTHWAKALDAVRAVERLISDARDLPTRRRISTLVESVTASARAADADRKLLDRVIDIRSATEDDPDWSATDAAYGRAFRDAGIDLATLSPAESGARITARPAAVAVVLAAALDDWAAVRRDKRRDRAGAERLTQAARIADPDTWRGELRDALGLPDKQKRLDALRALAGSARIDALPAVSLDLLGSALLKAGDPRAALGVLRPAQRRHPGDVWLNYDLGQCLDKLGRGEEALRYYMAARSIRPEVAHELAHALASRRQPDEALAEFQQLTTLRPGNGRHLVCFATALQQQGRAQQARKALDDAVAALREDIRQRPDDFWARRQLGRALNSQGKSAEAVAAGREAVRLRPDDASVHGNLGDALRSLGKLDEAVAEFREAIRLEPDNGYARDGLANSLEQQGKIEEAIAERRTTVRLLPGDHSSHENLGRALVQQGRFEEAIAELRTAQRIDPACPNVRENLAHALRGQGKIDQAIEIYREEIRRRPDDGEVHEQLARLFDAQGKTAEAIAEYREAVRLNPDRSSVRQWLADALVRKGQLDEAIAEARELIRRAPDDAAGHNVLAWDLALSPLRPPRDYDEALAHARRAVELAPEDANLVNTLALAEYRVGHWTASIAAARRSLELDKAQNGSNWFFLAMARARQGEKGDARNWFDKAVAWTRDKDPKNADLRQFWTEAAELLGQPGPDAPGKG